MKKCIVLLLPALLSIAALAQDTKPAAATTTSVATTNNANGLPVLSVPKHKCTRPEAPGSLANNAQQKNFVKEMDGYRDCLMAYRNDMNVLAKAHVEAANAAVGEFNDYIATVNKK